MAKKRRLQTLLLLPALALILFFFVLPYANLLFISFMTPGKDGPYDTIPTLANYLTTITDPFNWKVLGRTMWYGTLTTVITLVLGYPMAYHMSRASSRTKGLLLMLLISPLLVGVIIRSYGWMILLADKGLINTTLLQWGLVDHPLKLMYNPFGVMVGMVHIYLPFMVLSLAGNLQSIHPDLELAGRSLGASTWRTFWRITWPLSLPGVFAGTLMVWVLSVSAYVIPALLGGYNVLTAPMLVVQTVMDKFNWPLGGAQEMLMFLGTTIVVWTYVKLMNRAMRGLQ
jgi:putative spermidine/putrescine transport system permease protein